MHSEDAKIADVIVEHIQINKRKNHNGKWRIGAESKKRKRDGEGSYSSQIYFLKNKV
jgi:hypothetical protein